MHQQGLGSTHGAGWCRLSVAAGTAYRPVSLREVQAGDLEKLREHRNQPGTRLWLEDASELGADQQAKWFQQGGSRNLRIAVVEGEDIGLSRIALAAPGQIALVGLDLFARYRGQGLAKSVFRATCDAALQAGAGSLALWVFRDNLAAVRVYTAQNFTIDETEPVKWFVRQLPTDYAPARHAYIKMIR
jgi:RimJ/RimL family protein N-acetyltransferase